MLAIAAGCLLSCSSRQPRSPWEAFSDTVDQAIVMFLIWVCGITVAVVGFVCSSVRREKARRVRALRRRLERLDRP